MEIVKICILLIESRGQHRLSLSMCVNRPIWLLIKLLTLGFSPACPTITVVAVCSCGKYVIVGALGRMLLFSTLDISKLFAILSLLLFAHIYIYIFTISLSPYIYVFISAIQSLVYRIAVPNAW